MQFYTLRSAVSNALVALVGEIAASKCHKYENLPRVFRPDTIAMREMEALLSYTLRCFVCGLACKSV